MITQDDGRLAKQFSNSKITPISFRILTQFSRPKPSPATTMFPMKVPMMLPGAALNAIEETEVESPTQTQGIDSAHTASTALSAPENIAQKQPPK